MAILRGGRRIGNFDLRIGLPRDRSLDNVNADERLRRKPGGNRESTINRFMAEMGQGEGLGRPSRYLVVIHLPKPITTLAANRGTDPIATRQGTNTPPMNDLESANMTRNVGMMCNKITMPNRDINTATHLMYGPAREMPYAYSFSGQVECTFYGDKFNRQRLFFENWQKKIVDIKSHDLNYYKDYVGTVDILQLGAFSSQQDRDRVTYAVRLNEVYVQTVGSYDLQYSATDQGLNIPVTLNFRTWHNLTIDQVDGATVGQKFGDVPTIKAAKEFGLFSGILNRLPPEIRRVGRDVLQTTRRNLPIGRVTGGRVFPPFL